ncbi:MAG: DUF4294 domain-containing protein [Candidatus Treponema excrementipullorum]|uniref:DUF4294 domain-containing protein n=1 Tax=Phocaeicola faecicola TaxID=2739389 RepID=UPI0015E676BD|nr:DUF4294 domain-containing protein [Phocaeicola faecicola]MCI5743992.1 DUF4294 domain-containing protein [Bacteroides sp.]MDD6908617.1 DUF4294 domain-containing protein [Bacteroidaceae bacterium]MDY4466103.1 DUF4294 domain-containing protein [Candidatus Treponema excrementipullorum]
MRHGIYIVLFWLVTLSVQAQHTSPPSTNGYMVPVCVYQGDTIPSITLKNIYIYPKLRFKNKRQEKYYYKLVRDVKKTLPLAKEIKQIVIETYEFLETLPDEKSKNRHIKLVEKGLKEQYTPKMKKLTFSQGKLLIKLVNRECNQSSYQLVKAFMGPFKAGFYQTFAAVFGASLKKEYQPEDEDKMVERIIILVENGQL